MVDKIYVLPLSEVCLEWSKLVVEYLKLDYSNVIIDDDFSLKIGAKIRKYNTKENTLIIIGTKQVKNRTYLKYSYPHNTYDNEEFSLVEFYRDKKLKDLGL